LAGDVRDDEMPKIGPVLPDEGSEEEAGTDAFVGGAIGLAAGVIALLFPGLGWMIAAGPIAGALGGATAGVAAGGLYGILKDHSITEEQAEFYEEGVRRGGALITIEWIDEKRAREARRIMDKNGAIDVEKLADELRRTGWAGPKAKALKTS
jgi:hypothetical protein